LPEPSSFDDLELKMQLAASPRLTFFRRLAGIAWCLTVAFLLAMFVGTHIPARAEAFLANADKMLHFWAYFSLAMLLLISGELTLGPLQPIHFFSVWLACTLYGAMDEITQIPMGRNCDMADWMYDVLGVIVALTVFRVVRPFLGRVGIWIPATATH
jgi:VanZ family protein